MSSLTRWFPVLAAFIGGVTSMGLEVVAARTVHLAYVSHTIVWGSILTVFLAALGVGYFLGGRRARTRATSRELSRIMASTAIIIGLVGLLYPIALAIGIESSLPPNYQPLLSISLMFGPPAFLLGLISPYAAELVSNRYDVGQATGTVYAMGTVGSVVGAAATTFVIVPTIGVEGAFIVFLVLLGLLALVPAASRTDWGVVARVGIIVLLLTVHVGAIAFAPDPVYETNSAYHSIEVRDEDGVRTMYMNDKRHSAIYLDEERYVFDYYDALHLPVMYRADDPDSIDNVLIIGGGAGITAHAYAEEYNANVDSVELDPAVVHIAHEYFTGDHENITWHTQDGRLFLQGTDTEYDVIVLDAYIESSVPHHLTTHEFMQLANDRLTEDGVIVANVAATETGIGNELYRSMVVTFDSAFENVDAYPLGDEPHHPQNIAFVASDADHPSDATLRARAAERESGLADFSGMFDRRQPSDEIDVGDANVLRDDRGYIP